MVSYAKLNGAEHFMDEVILLSTMNEKEKINPLMRVCQKIEHR